MTINIDFVGGTHGHYLEFALNKLVAGDKISFDTPFDELGTSHAKSSINYRAHKNFACDHYFQKGGSKSALTVSITFEPIDLLAIHTVCLLRSSNYGIDNNLLHENTFFKLNNESYVGLLAIINDAYLPTLIYPISENNPHCPRYILRECFKFGFITPSVNGFMIARAALRPESSKVFCFPFDSFYDKSKFIEVVAAVLHWADLSASSFDIGRLHDEFLLRQPQRLHAQQCDNIISDVISKVYSAIPLLSLFQESYINAKLESTFGKEMPFMQETYFTNTQEIIEYLGTA